MPTYQKCEPGAARGLSHVKVKAAYGMGWTRAKIAPCDQQFKPLAIKPASWVYRPGAKGQGLVKANQQRS